MIVLLIIISALVIISCSNPNKANQGAAIETSVENELPIHPDDIMSDIKILEPDSVGSVYMEATYKNNSKYPITMYSLKVRLKDMNENTFLTCVDTVLPGETSSKFESFGPKTLDPNDYELLELSITAQNDDGEPLYIDYDLKLQTASW